MLYLFYYTKMGMEARASSNGRLQLRALIVYQTDSSYVFTFFIRRAQGVIRKHNADAQVGVCFKAECDRVVIVAWQT